MQVADTVLVGDGSTTAEDVTRFSAKAWTDASYEIKDESDGGDSDVDSGEDSDELEADSDDAGASRCAVCLVPLDRISSNFRHLAALLPLSSSSRDRNSTFVCSSGTQAVVPACRGRRDAQIGNLGRGRRNANKASETAERAAELAKLKKKQDALSAKKNEETYKRLTAQVCSAHVSSHAHGSPSTTATGYAMTWVLVCRRAQKTQPIRSSAVRRKPSATAVLSRCRRRRTCL